VVTKIVCSILFLLRCHSNSGALAKTILHGSGKSYTPSSITCRITCRVSVFFFYGTRFFTHPGPLANSFALVISACEADL
jgi:hypothetical protein